MNKGLAILGVLGIGVLAVGGKYTIDKLKRAAANIDFGISFNRIHGLVGEGVAKFLNPTIRLVFDLTLKNYSGLDLDASNIFTRIETKKPGETSWSIIATQQGYMNIRVPNGKEKTQQITVDVKGFSTIGSITNKKNSHRAVVKYTFKGIEMEYVKELDVAGPISQYWQNVKSKFSSLGAASIEAPKCIGLVA